MLRRFSTVLMSSVLFFLASLPFVKTIMAKQPAPPNSNQGSALLYLKHVNEINQENNLGQGTYAHGSGHGHHTHGSHGSGHHAHGSHGSHSSGSGK